MDPWQLIIWKLALNDSPSCISPSLSRPESRKLTHLRLTIRSGSAAPITIKPFYTAVGPFESSLETRSPCFGGEKYGVMEFVMELAKGDGASTREKSILVWSKCITHFSVFQSLLQAVHSMLISSPSFTNGANHSGTNSWLAMLLSDMFDTSRTFRHYSSTTYWYIVSRRKSDIYLKMVCIFTPIPAQTRWPPAI
jgi:hypothetical protein